ncbi:hypothetical protein FISHEDRAFT_67518 [Fistulina hepatica ATCC 64428]|uniref:Sodium/calcium exchanger membrane region domain-containing protein n=1 Tax=Fistulina hepatica ATCC 64428 TaxID=1128425 RepID=A0A0D7A057_9AGAR|nr:hypothetical protein FISHEDRAFT_67518 [Fistulina hepatica ATCC 64428]
MAVPCLVALVPLVSLHDIVTHDLLIRIGGSKTGLLNASMSNTVGTVVAVTALRKCELTVVQSSLVGAILSKLLLVLGLCFLAGGIRFSEQTFDSTATQMHSSLLSISVGSLLIPAIYHFVLSGDTSNSSHICSLTCLLCHLTTVSGSPVYISYLVFQLYSHNHLFEDNKYQAAPRHKCVKLMRRIDSEETAVGEPMDLKHVPTEASLSPSTPPGPPRVPEPLHMDSGSPYSSTRSVVILPDSTTSSRISIVAVRSTVRLVDSNETAMDEDHLSMGCSLSRSHSTASTASLNNSAQGRSISPAPAPAQHRSFSPTPTQLLTTTHKTPQISWFVTLFTLTSVAAAAYFMAEWLVDSMNGIPNKLSKEWVGLILLPGITSIAECMSAVTISVKDQLTLSIGTAVGATIQTSLCVTPVMVLLGWAMGKPLSMLFDPFLCAFTDAVALEAAIKDFIVQTVGYVVNDGKSNWLEGIVLIALYIVIAVSFWFYPGSDYLPSHLAICNVR